MIKELREQISYFVKNKMYLISLVIAAIAGYTYQLTHGTCGIDDISIGLYFEKGLGVAIGRWPFYLINKMIPIASEYQPFFCDFITLLILMISAVVWCGLLRMVLRQKVSIWCYIVFSVLFLDYSMISEVFVFYLQNGLGFVYLLTGLALFGSYYLLTRQNDVRKAAQKGISCKENIAVRIGLIGALTIAVSFYESAANLYLSGVLLLIYIDMMDKKEETVFSLKHIIGTLVFTARYLVYAMIFRRLIRTVIMKVFGIMPYSFYRSASLSWLLKGGMGKIWENLSVVFEEVWENFFAAGTTYLPITLFVMASLVFLVHLIWNAVKEKKILPLVIGIGFYVSMFILSFVQGSAVTYRACQIFSVFIGVILMGILKWVLKQTKIFKVIGLTAVFSCLFLSVLDLNRWFVLDYKKTEYEMSVLEEIANDLQNGGYDIEKKPIVVVGDFELPEEMTEAYGYSQNRNSIIQWSVKAFAMHYGYNVPIRQFFEYLGYEFLWAEQELCREVFEEYYPLDRELYDMNPLMESYTELYEEDEQYPNVGYIEEKQDYIVVKL